MSSADCRQMNKEARRLLHIESAREFGSNVAADLRERQGHACNESRVLCACIASHYGVSEKPGAARKRALRAGLRAPMGVPIIPAAIKATTIRGTTKIRNAGGVRIQSLFVRRR